MTGKQRMMTALNRQKPDRLPVTVHQWHPYHLEHYMGGVDQVDAFTAVHLDASITPSDVLLACPSAEWLDSWEDLETRNGERFQRHRISTPDGELTRIIATDQYTTFNVEHLIKNERDAELFLRYCPATRLDRSRLSTWYDRTADRGIVRGFVAHYAQPGTWQELCELTGTQEAILWAIDNPQFVHHVLDGLTSRRVEYIHCEMAGAKYDLIEHGGGAASSTVISPQMFDEFCLPYDRRIIAALHDVGFPVVYHTCGGMMAILDHIPRNGADASETLSPPAVGGDIRAEQRRHVKEILGSKVALIGGLDQGRLLSEGSPAEVESEVVELFETFGAGGGYICSASDHFFNAPVENLRAMAGAARQCTY